MVNLIFRSKKRNEYSIEVIFQGLSEELNRRSVANKCTYIPNEHYNSIRSIIENIRFIRKSEGDIFHITGEVYFLGLVLPKNRTIITIHDLVMLNHDHAIGLKYYIFKYFWFYIPIKRSKAIVCISEKTRDDLVRLFPSFSKKVIVIPNPYGNYIKENSYKFNKEMPTILAIGTRQNKNLERIIRALSEIDCKLVIVGRLSEKQLELLKENNIFYENRFNLTNEQMFMSYCDADIVCFPSMYEGFGMPVIEAQIVGRPVITSKISPLTEIAGDGALYINPYDMLEIRSAIRKLMYDEILRNQLISKGRINASKYSLKAIADKYIKVYSTVLGYS